MMTMSDLAGYTASTVVLLTFMCKDMRLLRANDRSPPTMADPFKHAE
jgi:hypothetical protein